MYWLVLAVISGLARAEPQTTGSQPQSPFPQLPSGFPQIPTNFPQPPIPEGFPQPSQLTGALPIPEGFPQPSQLTGSLPIPQLPGAPQSPPPSSAALFDNPSSQTPIPIISLDIQNKGDGSYQYSYETGNGIKAEESGYQKEVPGTGTEPPSSGTAARGSYSYTDPDGNLIQVTYTADENGFQPQGAHLPTPPPVPAAILRALEIQAQAQLAAGHRMSPAFETFFRSAYRRPTHSLYYRPDHQYFHQ